MLSSRTLRFDLTNSTWVLIELIASLKLLLKSWHFRSERCYDLFLLFGWKCGTKGRNAFTMLTDRRVNGLGFLALQPATDALPEQIRQFAVESRVLRGSTSPLGKMDRSCRHETSESVDLT